MNNLHQYIFESLDTYKDLFDNAHDLIHIAAPDGQLIYINNAWKRLLGYTKEEAHGASVYNFIMESDRDRFKKYREEMPKKNRKHRVDLRIRMGKKLTINAGVYPRHISRRNNPYQQ